MVEKAAERRKNALRANAKWICAACMLVLIFIRPQQAVEGGQRAMRLWYTGVAPAMLPFLALMPLLTGAEACAAYERMLSGIMRRLFGLPGSAAPAVVAAMLCGSPGGAIAIGNVCAAGGIDRREARRISLALSGVSPAWLVMGVGCGMLGSKAEGLKFALIQAAVQLFLLKLLEKVEIPGSEKQGEMPAVRMGMWHAVESTLGVCGYMVFFGACGSVIASFAGKNVGVALLAVLDLPTGIAEIAKLEFPARAMALGCALGFGGICIGVQNTDRLSAVGIRRREYFAVRGLAASLTGMMSTFILKGSTFDAAWQSGSVNIYGISLLGAAVCAVPGMIFLSKNIFLNNSDLAEKGGSY